MSAFTTMLLLGSIHCTSPSFNQFAASEVNFTFDRASQGTMSVNGRDYPVSLYYEVIPTNYPPNGEMMTNLLIYPSSSVHAVPGTKVEAHHLPLYFMSLETALPTPQLYSFDQTVTGVSEFEALAKLNKQDQSFISGVYDCRVHLRQDLPARD